MALLFERSARLLAAADFTACFAARQRVSGRYLILNWSARDGAGRLGLAVSRKADKRAVVRNRIKRVVRQQFRLNLPRLHGRDLVVSAKREAASATRAELAQDFLALLQRLPALPSPPVQGTMPAASTGLPPASVVTNATLAPSAGSPPSPPTAATPTESPEQ